MKSQNIFAEKLSHFWALTNGFLGRIDNLNSDQEKLEFILNYFYVT